MTIENNGCSSRDARLHTSPSSFRSSNNLVCPFFTSLVPLELFSDCFGNKFSQFYSKNNNSIRNTRGICYFAMFFYHLHMDAIVQLDVSRICNLLACILKSILCVVKKPFGASLNQIWKWAVFCFAFHCTWHYLFTVSWIPLFGQSIQLLFHVSNRAHFLWDYGSNKSTWHARRALEKHESNSLFPWRTARDFI